MRITIVGAILILAAVVVAALLLNKRLNRNGSEPDQQHRGPI